MRSRHVLTLLTLLAATPALASTYNVNVLTDADDANPGDNVCQTATVGQCTFRAAIQEANAHAGPDDIVFGSNVQGNTISPLTLIPPITETVSIDGGSDYVRISGASSSQSTDGLIVSTGDNLFNKLSITDFAGHGIRIDSGNTTIKRCLIGITPQGTEAGNGGDGIHIATGVSTSQNSIGGGAPGEGNVISGNGGNGVSLFGGNTRGNILRNNLIGTTLDGDTGLGNDSHGVFVGNFAHDNLIGTETAGNVVSGNGGQGILLASESEFNTVAGNRIGLATASDTPIPNAGHGVLITGDSSSNEIGLSPESGNIIAFNLLSGVAVDPGSDDNSIIGNSIFENTVLGIDLGVGANENQQAPALTSISYLGGNQVSVLGTLAMGTTAQHLIDVYESPACDPSGSGEGKTYLASSQLIASANTTAPLAVIATPTEGSFLTAVATRNLNGSTSEFSNCFQVSFPAVCGDGVKVAGEGCDDGNTDAGDGCDAECNIEEDTGTTGGETTGGNTAGTSGDTGGDTGGDTSGGSSGGGCSLVPGFISKDISANFAE